MIATLCAVHGTRLYPHVWGSAISLYASINLCFAMPDIPQSLNPEVMLLELDRTPNVFREKLARQPLEVIDGKVYPTTKPGLGIEIDEDFIEKYRID